MCGYEYNGTVWFVEYYSSRGEVLCADVSCEEACSGNSCIERHKQGNGERHMPATFKATWEGVASIL